MQTLTILNTRDIKHIRQLFEETYGSFFTGDYVYLQGKDGRLSLINKDIGKIDLKKLRVDKFGLYVAEIKGNAVRLSKEGAQLLAKEARDKLKHVVELDNREIKAYFHGVDIRKDLGSEAKFVLIEYDGDIVGCSKYKEGIILNYLPKIHRGEVIV
ncbi:hypothetical protein HYZ76_00995 [Candidatus Falkowbacteria bacterium]|nr:hypothetical protein [Candidatus Falkowbacteria bacterium]